MAVDLGALTVILRLMPASAVNGEEDLRVQRAQEREQQERRDERPPRRRWLTVVQVLAVIVAMVLALYNNALINQLPTPNDDEVAWLTSSETMEPVAPCNQGGVRLFTGFDTNGNGVLDLAERGEPFEMCHGLQGLSARPTRQHDHHPRGQRYLPRGRDVDGKRPGTSMETAPLTRARS